MTERSGYRPSPAEQRGFSQSRKPERINPRPTRHDRPLHEYRSYVESTDDPNRKTFGQWWKDLSPGAKGAYGAGAIGAIAAVVGIGVGYGRLTDNIREGNLKESPITDADNPSVIGHDPAAPRTSEPSVTVTSAPPGKEPVTITVPKK